MSKTLKIILRLYGYRTSTITVAQNMGSGEVMTVIYKAKP